MRAGSLRHRITIQEQTETVDAIGGYSASWSDYHECWAAVWPIKSVETSDAMKLENQITHQIRIRYVSGITTKHRIIFGSRTFQIVSARNWEERNIYIDLMTTEEA